MYCTFHICPSCFPVIKSYPCFRFLVFFNTLPDIRRLSVLVQITTSSLDCLIQVALDQIGLIEQTGRKIDITIIIRSLATLRRSKLTHPSLLTLEHEAPAVAFAAFLHSYRQQRVEVAAVQHSFDLHDTAQRYQVQFCLSKSD